MAWLFKKPGIGNMPITKAFKWFRSSPMTCRAGSPNVPPWKPCLCKSKTPLSSSKTYPVWRAVWRHICSCGYHWQMRVASWKAPPSNLTSIKIENLLATVAQHRCKKNGEQTKNGMRARFMDGYCVFMSLTLVVNSRRLTGTIRYWFPLSSRKFFDPSLIFSQIFGISTTWKTRMHC